jgi:hypothetical protein
MTQSKPGPALTALQRVSVAGKYCRSIGLVLGLSLGFASGFAKAENPHVIELFTSHGCSSCPSADELLGQLIESDENLIALEFHVDYWNSLVHGDDGNFIDPFSSAANTARQQHYDQSALDGRAGVFTPQVVIDGRYAAVGSDKRRITKALSSPSPLHVKVVVTPAADGLTVSVDAAEDEQATVWFVSFLREQSTAVTGGENRHLTIINHHVVTEMRPLGQLANSSLAWQVDWPADPEVGCAVIVQADALEPVLGAAVCP